MRGGTSQANARPRTVREGSSAAQANARPRTVRAAGSAGQASVELIAILGISLLVILVFAVLSSDMISDLNAQSGSNDAYESVKKLASAADSVYAQGEGASQNVLVNIPTTAVLDSDSSYIGKPSNAPSSALSNVINIRLDDSDVFTYTKAPLAGSFPNQTGIYTMRVVSKGSYVAIGAHFLDVSKSSVFVSMARSEVRTDTLTFTAAGNESVNVVIVSSWGYGNVALNISQSSFTVSTSDDGSQNVVLTFTSNSTAGGLYSTVFDVTGTAANGVVETFDIPITVDVQA